jgi:hypothetical protein
MNGVELFGANRYFPFTAIFLTFAANGEPGIGVSLPLLAAAKPTISFVLLFLGVVAT